ncbi:hypothetical protein CMUS01_16151 [Colletotrichum musicola]|uniref:Uncharacterized protein n=1 Tax=Colletotrichum musicola TaxID=2175873 RepID=A0A8H6MJN9_9PEZI|nr:hypothetical protein CMUS01_16151 [Colletotrichum musicola]
MDAARLVSSFNIVEELAFKERRDKGVKKVDSGKVDISLFYYMQSTPLANHDAVTPASLPSSNRPVCTYQGACIRVDPNGELDVTSANESGFSWAMGGHVDLEKLEELDVDLTGRHQDLRRLEQLDVGWEGRYLNLHRIMGRCLARKPPDPGDSCEGQVRHQLVDFKQVLDAYASALRQAERRDNPTPDIRSLLRHRDATQHTSANNSFYRLLHRKP